MLQQTQVSRVLPKYEEFLYFFPDVYALAASNPAKILKVWKGMGYNRRALYLHKAARVITQKYHGEFPETEEELTKLPGVGNYTARALLVFACKESIPLVDTNIRKIITHFFFKGKPQKPSVIQNAAEQLLPKEQAWEWNQALMDYGALALNVSRVTYHVSRKAKPFKDSNRFYRGRIVDRLREGEVREQSLIEELKATYRRERQFFKGLLRGLIKEELIERSGSTKLRLPQ